MKLNRFQVLVLLHKTKTIKNISQKNKNPTIKGHFKAYKPCLLNKKKISMQNDSFVKFNFNLNLDVSKYFNT